MIFISNNSKHSNALFFKITVLAWLLMKIISWKVWIPNRLIPTVPFFEWTQIAEFSYGLFSLSLVLLIYFFISNPSNRFLFLFLWLEILQLLLDQNRWQPWEFQFLLTTIFYLNFKNSDTFKSLLLLLLSATYIFSGLHKFNLGFLESNWGNLILKNIFGIQNIWKSNDYIFYLGFMIPFIETTLGVLLLTLKNKTLPIFVLISMHIFIFFILSPLGVNYNVVVWPWNVMMGVLLFSIYKDEFDCQFQLIFFKKIYTQVTLILIFVLPIFNLFGGWEHYLSFGLYSGKNSNICLCFDISEETKSLKPFVSETNKYNFCPNQSAVFLNKLALSELKVPIYPEPRVYKFLENSFKEKYPNTDFQWIYYQPDYALKLRKELP
jgi:hypothetical protein